MFSDGRAGIPSDEACLTAPALLVPGYWHAFAWLIRSILLRPYCFVCQLQAEVDKQDDMPDFSKTDAYRSSKSRQSEEQARPTAGEGLTAPARCTFNSE